MNATPDFKASSATLPVQFDNAMHVVAFGAAEGR
jgi:hypothetical protein